MKNHHIESLMLMVKSPWNHHARLPASVGRHWATLAVAPASGSGWSCWAFSRQPEARGERLQRSPKRYLMGENPSKNNGELMWFVFFMERKTHAAKNGWMNDSGYTFLRDQTDILLSSVRHDSWWVRQEKYDGFMVQKYNIHYQCIIKSSGLWHFGINYSPPHVA